MNKTLFFSLSVIVVFLLAIFVGSFLAKSNKPSTRTPTPTSVVIQAPTLTPSPDSFYLFVPHWSLKPQTKREDIVTMGAYQSSYTNIYFSLEAKNFVIDKSSTSWQKYLQFKKLHEGQNFMLSLRLTDDRLLEPNNQERTNKLFYEAITLTLDSGASGLVLDLEPKVAKSAQMLSAWNSFASQCESSGLKCSLTVFASELIGAKYDFSLLDQNLDKIFVLAYDDGVLTGQHGPNLSLRSTQKYTNSLEKLVLGSFIPKNLQVVFVFGAFGRDTVVDINKKPLSSPSPLSLAQIRDKYLKNCNSSNCVVSRDPQIAEQEIDFVDKTVYHQIWFDDEISIKQKIDFLRSRNYHSFGIFAWGYY